MLCLLSNISRHITDNILDFEFSRVNKIRFHTKPILRCLLNLPLFPLVLLDLSLFLDEILMPRSSTNYARFFSPCIGCWLCKVLFLAKCWFSISYARFFLSLNYAWILVFQVVSCAMHWGTLRRCASSLLGSYVHQELI